MEAKLSVEGALQVLSPAGRQNYNARKSVDVSVFGPNKAAAALHTVPNVWQDTEFAIPAYHYGGYSMWCVALSCCIALFVSWTVRLQSQCMTQHLQAR